MRLNTKPLCLLLLTFFISAVIHAQMISDIVYLKNGSVIKGMIVEQVPGKTIKVRTRDNLLIEINYQDIARIVKEETFAKENGSPNSPAGPLLRRYFFKVNGGFFTGDALGYTFGASAGIRLGDFSLAFNYQKTVPDDNLTHGKKYDRFDSRSYSIKGFYNLSTERLINPYFGLGVGYSATPHTGGSGKIDGTHFGYYNSYVVNPAVGIDIPIGQKNFLFTELNYHWHYWTKTHGFYPGISEGPPRKTAQVIYLVTGVKF